MRYTRRKSQIQDISDSCQVGYVLYSSCLLNVRCKKASMKCDKGGSIKAWIIEDTRHNFGNWKLGSVDNCVSCRKEIVRKRAWLGIAHPMRRLSLPISVLTNVASLARIMLTFEIVKRLAEIRGYHRNRFQKK